MYIWRSFQFLFLLLHDKKKKNLHNSVIFFSVRQEILLPGKKYWGNVWNKKKLWNVYIWWTVIFVTEAHSKLHANYAIK